MRRVERLGALLAVLGAVLLIVLLATQLGDSYPLHGGPPAAGQNSPATVGQPVTGVVLFIEVRPGDRIELLGADALGVADGSTVDFLFAPPVPGSDGSQSIGDQLEPLVGAVAESVSASPGPENTVGIVARMTASKPGRYVLSGLRLHYRLNGGAEETREGIDVVFTVCADDPAPVDCPLDDPTAG
jgi:hypothetical protein